MKRECIVTTAIYASEQKIWGSFNNAFYTFRSYEFSEDDE